MIMAIRVSMDITELMIIGGVVGALGAVIGFVCGWAARR